MTRTMIALAALALAGGCNNPAPDPDAPAAVTTAPDEREMPLTFETAPMTVDAASVIQQDPAVLAAAAWTAKQCSLTVPGDAADFSSEVAGPTRFTGFFIGPDDQPAGDFKIVLKGQDADYLIPARTGWDRTDVADYFQLPQLASSGFDVNADLSGVAEGAYRVDFVLERNGAFFCESGKRLLVENSAGVASPSGDSGL